MISESLQSVQNKRVHSDPREIHQNSAFRQYGFSSILLKLCPDYSVRWFIQLVSQHIKVSQYFWSFCICMYLSCLCMNACICYQADLSILKASLVTSTIWKQIPNFWKQALDVRGSPHSPHPLHLPPGSEISKQPKL